jgi:hypothetical protein
MICARQELIGFSCASWSADYLHRRILLVGRMGVRRFMDKIEDLLIVAF